jgi:hypothetical protein
MSLYIASFKLANSNSVNTPFPQPLTQVHETIVAVTAIGLFNVARDNDF